MRHRVSRNRLRQKPAHSRLLQRNLLTSLFLYESIRTTKKRAEVIQPMVDRLITVAKTKDPMNAIRALNQVLTHVNASRKTMEVFKQRYAARTSGFTRMTPLGSRIGDGADLVTLSFIDADLSISSPEAAPKKEKKVAAPKAAKKPAAAKKNISTSTVSSLSAEASSEA
ncbi:MAG: large subunit ribosomal protein [Candidatus Peribacteria bacterium]|nr:large subunit ribosomal protein [Candidatus Peribacteria bacterium]